MQQPSFWAAIMYFLSLIGCGGGDYIDYPEPVEPIDRTEIITEAKPDHQANYERSLEQWNKDKKEHNDSYKFALSFSSAEGNFGQTTHFVVKEGLIVERSYESYVFDDDGNKKQEDKYAETKKQIGNNNKGFPAKTLTELYDDCGNIYLPNSSPGDYIYFDSKFDGIMSICGYVPKNCADDCFEGVSLDYFEWL